jgi:PKD repeat protein
VRRRFRTSIAITTLLIAGVPGAVAHAAPAVDGARLSPAALAAGVGSVPRPDHIVVVVEENHSGTQIIGNPAAPYITSLAANNANFTSSFALTHPSQPNYIGLFSGSTQGVTDNACPYSFAAPSLGDRLIAGGHTFVGYSESQPSAGYTGCESAALYARKHNPWVNFPAIPAASNQPFTAFPSDFTTLPDVSFVVPNLQNDMHDGTIAQGDAWLQNNLSGYINWAKTHNSLLIFTFDEDDNSAGNRIATIFAGERVVPGSYAETINHYNVLRTIEDAFGITPLGASATSPPIMDVWTAPAGDPPPVAAFTSSCQGLTCSFDGTGSTDDTSVVGWTWDFGDGTSGTGSTVSHVYAGSGTFAVSLRVTDDQGATSAPVTHSVTVTAPAGAAFASDTFNRTVTNGLGTADVGGAWSTVGAATAFSVSPGAAAYRLAAGAQLTGFLPSAPRTDADVLTAVSLNAVPVGGAVYLMVQGRRVSSGNEYNAKMLINADRSVTIRVSRLVGNAETVLAGPLKIAGLTYAAGMALNVRLQVTGTSPTTVRARAWAGSATEPPSWQVSGTDSTAALQAAGAVGLTGYMSAAVTPSPIIVSFSSLTAKPTTAPANQPPTAAFTSTCTQLSCSFSGSGSTDVDGTVTGWSWDFGDGATGTGPSLVHAYVLAGTYPVTLTVTDNQGAPNSVTHSVIATAPPANQSPVAAFTFSCTNLTCSFNGTGSSDDEAVTGWSWNFGDSSAGSGSTVSHPFATAGTYQVQLTVSDGDGATNSVTKPVAVSITPTNPPFVSDTFNRTVANGLGTADIGGAWSTVGGATGFSVAPGAAAFRLSTAGSQLSGFLAAAPRTDADVLAAVALDKVPVGGAAYVTVYGRRVSSGNEYDAKVLVNADRSVTLRVTRVVGGVETALKGPITIPGVVYAPAMVLNIRLQVTGTGTTTVRARAWLASGTEPAAWQVSGTDSTAALQAAGAVGVSGYLSSAATNAPVTLRLSGLIAKPTGG